MPDRHQLRASSAPALHRAVLGDSITSPNQVSTALPKAASEHADVNVDAVLLKLPDLALAQGRCAAAHSRQLTL